MDHPSVFLSLCKKPKSKLFGNKQVLLFFFFKENPLQFKEQEQLYLHFKQLPSGALCNLWIALTLEAPMTATEFYYSYKVN